MREQWFIIDRWGRRSINCRADNYWSRFDYGAMDIDWPEFNQFVTRAPEELVVKALRTFGSMLGVALADVTDEPDRWQDAILIAENASCLIVSEPGVDLDERLLRPESADAIAGLLADDGAFFGYDPVASTVHVTTYEMGAPTLDWYDSVMPGPSYARTFLQNGRARDEDPRPYALRALDLPESSPLLDRHAFVERVLQPFELHTIEPNLDSLRVVRALRLA